MATDNSISSGADSRPAIDDAARWDSLPEATRAEIIKLLFALDEARKVDEETALQRADREAARDAQKAHADAVERSLQRSGLDALGDECAEGYVRVVHDVSAIRINRKVPPLVLVATALSRAERCEAMAMLLAQVGTDAVEDAMYQLHKMVAELRDILRVAVDHDGLAQVGWPAAEAGDEQ